MARDEKRFLELMQKLQHEGLSSEEYDELMSDVDVSKLTEVLGLDKPLENPLTNKNKREKPAKKYKH